jgi:hypothetical protein
MAYAARDRITHRNARVSAYFDCDATANVARLRCVEHRLDQGAPTSVATAGAATITAAMILSGIYVRDCAGAGRTDTLSTAALLVAALTDPRVGDTLRLYIINGSDAAETLTIAAGTGGAFDTNQTAASRVVPQNASRLLHIRLTNVTSGAEAYVCYL